MVQKKVRIFVDDGKTAVPKNSVVRYGYVYPPGTADWTIELHAYRALAKDGTPREENFKRAAQMFFSKKSEPFIWHPWAEDMLHECCYSQFVGQGITENIVRSHSDAAIAVKALEVESGRILAQRQFAKRNSGNRRALDECAAQMESALPSISFGALAKDDEVPRHKVVIKPTAGGNDMMATSSATRRSPAMSKRASAKSRSAKAQTPSGATAIKS